MTFWQNLNYKVFKSGNKLFLLIGINVIVFLLINVPGVFERLILRSDLIVGYTTEFLALPAYLPKLLVRFWTPFTYMFMHASVLHILFNMLWLYWMGQIFEEFLGNRRITGLYLLGGLAGAIFFIAAYNLFPLFTESSAVMNATVVGGSASVMAVIVGAATIAPNYSIPLLLIGPVRLKWLVLFYVVLDFLGVTGPNAGGQIAHLGGALMGFVYVSQLKKGNDWIAWIANLFKRKSKLKVASNNTTKRAEASSKPRQDEIDRILDKISQTGYEKLSQQEKETLFRASKHEEK
jgi:membrane associated rhomboid family serine protease